MYTWDNLPGGKFAGEILPEKSDIEKSLHVLYINITYKHTSLSIATAYTKMYAPSIL